LCWDLEKLLHFATHCCDPLAHLLPRFSVEGVQNTTKSSKNLRQINTHKNYKNWDKSTHSQITTKTETKINTHKNCKKNSDKGQHIKIATKTETKIDRHKICNKNSDKSTHIKIAITEKNQYTKNLQQKLRENKKHIKFAKTATKSHTHTHTHKITWLRLDREKNQKKGRAQESPIVVPSSISTCNNSRAASSKCN
jgi:hypothetical protein